MRKIEIIAILEDISNDMKRDLAKADEMWDARAEHARIVGYLQESLRVAKRRIDKLSEK